MIYIQSSPEIQPRVNLCRTPLWTPRRAPSNPIPETAVSPGGSQGEPSSINFKRKTSKRLPGSGMPHSAAGDRNLGAPGTHGKCESPTTATRSPHIEAENSYQPSPTSIHPRRCRLPCRWSPSLPVDPPSTLNPGHCAFRRWRGKGAWQGGMACCSGEYEPWARGPAPFPDPEAAVFRTRGDGAG